ncbi:MAG: enoyl-CoA hydratase-related protein [Chryseolinea sp.]
MSVIQTDHTDSILVVTISRPEALNALNVDVLTGLHTIIQEAYQKEAIKGIIITGEGDKAFIAGADIKELSLLNKEQAFALAQKGQILFKQIEDSPKPIIAAVNGFALGGGCELAMACHIRIATENAKFGQPEVNLGIVPGYGGTQRLTQLVGRGKALELIMTADFISAQEAKAIGLVNHVVANREELIELATKMMTKILSKSPIAIEHVIKSVNAGFRGEEMGYQTEAESFAVCAASEDFKEGSNAFMEKRRANFKGA